MTPAHARVFSKFQNFSNIVQFCLNSLGTNIDKLNGKFYYSKQSKHTHMILINLQNFAKYNDNAFKRIVNKASDICNITI